MVLAIFTFKLLQDSPCLILRFDITIIANCNRSKTIIMLTARRLRYLIAMKINFSLLIALFFCFPSISFSQGSDVAQFDHLDGKLTLTPFLAVFVDPGKSLSIDDIIKPEFADSFVASSVTGTSFGFSEAVHWVRFSICQAGGISDSLLVEVEYPLLDNVSIYIPDGLGGFTERHSGDAHFFSTRDVMYRNNLFRIPGHGGDTRTYYMRIQTEGSMQIPMSLWTSDAFIEHVDNSNILIGTYYGIMLLLMLAALIFYFKIRDILFLSYAFYLLSYIIFQFSLNGLSFQYLWPDSPEYTSRLTSAFVGMVIIGGLFFSGSFLHIWGNRHPRVKWLFYVLMACGLLSSLMSLLGDFVLAVRIAAISGVFLPPTVIIAIWSSLAIGYRPARYFLVAWCLFLCGVFGSALLYLGFLPHTFLTVYAMQIGSTLEVLLLGYALMDKIDLLREDKENARELANSYLIQLNEKLESLVAERTRELSESNKELKELAVRDSMTGLLNHKASIEYLQKMQKYAHRYGHDLSVVMLDVDHFKRINDTYGHSVGDIVLILIADVVAKTLRESDGCGRYGGEEFIMILSETDVKDAWKLAERMRKNVEALEIEEIDGTSLSVSLGISIFDPADPEANLMLQADKALYNAKNNGRNQVQVYG